MIERTRSRYLWSEANVNGTRMGRYLTGIESKLIAHTFDELGWPNLLLDVGGGDGRLVKPLLNQGLRPVILEHDQVPLEELKGNGWPDPLVIGDGNDLPIRSASMDAVLTFEVAQCTNASHNGVFFKEVFRVLKKHGKFLFVTDNRHSLIGACSEFGENRKKPGEQRLYYSEEISETRTKLIESGFQIRMLKGFRWIPFNRTSDNKLIPIFASLEKVLKLGDLINYSPWVFWAAIK